MDWHYDTKWKFFKEYLYNKSGVDLNLYKQSQMHRRVNYFLARNGIKNYEELLNRLAKDKDLYSKFMDYLTINVTEFFRTPEPFAELESVIIPIWQKQKHKSPLRIWSAGCSMGAEPYSVAMILDNCDVKTDYKILATDIDEQMLAKAGGPYVGNELKNVPPDLLKKYFVKTDKGYVIIDRIKEKVVFKKHNLLSDNFIGIFDLILCRNVMIYFIEEAKDDLYEKFHHSLKEGGILFLGGTETINNFKKIGYKPIRPFFYQKV